MEFACFRVINKRAVAVKRHNDQLYVPVCIGKTAAKSVEIAAAERGSLLTAEFENCRIFKQLRYAFRAAAGLAYIHVEEVFFSGTAAEQCVERCFGIIRALCEGTEIKHVICLFYCGDSDMVIADILAEFIRRTAVFQRHPNRRGGYAVCRGHKSVGNAVTPCVFNRFLAELVIADSRNHHRFAAELCEMRREIERCAADTAVVAEHIKKYFAEAECRWIVNHNHTSVLNRAL